MNLSLKVKSIFWVSSLLFITGSVLTANAVFQQQKVLREEMIRRGLFAVDTLAKGSALSMILEDNKSLQELVESIKKEKDVAYCLVTSQKGNIQAISGSRLLIPAKIISWAKEIEKPDVSEVFPIGRDRYFEFAAPVKIKRTERALEAPLLEEVIPEAMDLKEEKIGVVRIGLSLKGLNSEIVILIRKNIIWMIITTVFGIFGILFFVTKEFISFIKLTLVTLGIIAKEGDLTKRIAVQREDEIGDITKAFNKLMDTFQNIVSQLKKSAETVAASAGEVSASTQEMNDTTQEVSRSTQQIAKGAAIEVERVEEVSRAMQEMARSLQEVTEKAEKTTEYAIRVNRRAQAGKVSTQEAVERIQRISGIVYKIAEIINTLGGRSLEIGEITEVITSIADQTNLLSLNAAIEAARAGEAGKSFAVVAEEIRKLSENSSASANRIGQLLKDVQSDTDKAVYSTELGLKEVTEGRGVMDTVSGSLEEMMHSIEEATMMIKEISQATKEQLLVTDKVVETTAEVANIIQESSASIQEVSSNVEEHTAGMQEISSSTQMLAKLAAELQKLVGRFKL